MSTILASTSQADSVSTTTSVFPYDTSAVVTAISINGNTPPTQGNQVALQISPDNVTYTEVDRRLFAMGPGAEDIQLFELSNYAGNSGSAYMNGYNSTLPPLFYKLVFGGNTGSAVTISASSTQTRSMAVVPLVGTTATTGGAVGSWTPPQGGTGIVVERIIANITTKSTGAANLSGGIAANATTSATNFIPATAVGSAAVVLDSITLQIIAATAAESGINPLAVAMTSAQSVTFTGSASTAGLVGTAYIEYLLPP